jgi:hypothetical protein
VITVVVASNALANVHLGTFIISGRIFVDILIRDWLQWSCKIQGGVKTVSSSFHITYPFLENPVMLGLETTVHHTSALKFYTCARKMEQFFRVVPVGVAFVLGICQFTVRSNVRCKNRRCWV